MTIALSGTLGAGKTQWTRFFATQLGAPPQAISSPTFVLVHQYPSQPPIFHLDAYRVGDEDELLDLGIEEMMESDAITVIEWADRFPQLLPRDCLSIHFDLGTDSDHRIVNLYATGPRSQEILAKLVSLES
jgi:tRNA threonylcarbamoyladenosine biosynthesis protein TsaE